MDREEMGGVVLQKGKRQGDERGDREREGEGK